MWHCYSLYTPQTYFNGFEALKAATAVANGWGQRQRNGSLLKNTTINTSDDDSPVHVTINGPRRNKTPQTSSINNKEFTNNSRRDRPRL
jgi:hypothetical protein